MKRTAGFLSSICALLLLALTSTTRAETVTASVPLTPAGEVPPITGLDANGGVVVTVNVTRDSAGNITGGTVNFLATVQFPGSVTIVGFHIHKGPVNNNGGIVIDSGLSGTNPMVLTSGVGLINLNAPTVNVTALRDLLANPAGHYVNIHTSVNTGGAIRGQIVRLVETQAVSVEISPANEVPPITTLTATGTGTITANPVRDSLGVITGGTVTFTMNYDLPPNTEVTGLHIHKGPAGMNGGIVIETSISGSNSIILATGKGTITQSVPLTTAGPITALKELVDDPTGFYVNMHTRTFPGGALRGQLTTLATSPNVPVIQQSNTAFLPTSTTDAQIGLLVTGIDLASGILVNGQPVGVSLDITTGRLGVMIPSAFLANAGTLFLQARNGQGLLSAPVAIVVAPQENVNTIPATTVDAAKFGTLVSPESIVAAFGSKLASQVVSATRIPLPTVLDGTSVYVSGIASQLFFVSEGQVNYLLPSGTPSGAAEVVVVAKDGTVSRGLVNVAPTIPAIFTRRADGTGAPAAVASADGQNFNIVVSNPDGTPVPLDAGNFMSVFCTGLRFASTPLAITIGDTAVTPLFFGPQGELVGLDQVNLQIPATLAGKGNVDMVFTLDGKTSNIVKLNIK